MPDNPNTVDIDLINQAITPLPCYSRRDVVDRMDRSSFMRAMNEELERALPLLTGREWRGRMHRDGGSWIFHDDEANVLQFRYKERRSEAYAEMSVALRLSLGELKPMLVDRIHCESTFALWVEEIHHRVLWDVTKWAEVVDVSMPCIDYPAHLPVPRGTYALMASEKGLIQTMTPEQAVWAANALVHLASLQLHLKRLHADMVPAPPRYQYTPLKAQVDTWSNTLSNWWPGIDQTDEANAPWYYQDYSLIHPCPPNLYNPWPWISIWDENSLPALADEIGPYYYDAHFFPERLYTDEQPWTHCIDGKTIRY